MTTNKIVLELDQTSRLALEDRAARMISIGPSLELSPEVKGTGVELFSKEDGMFEKEIDFGTFCYNSVSTELGTGQSHQ